MRFISFVRFDTTIAPLTYSNQFIEISTTLQTQYLYGIGGSVDSLQKSVNGSRYILYNHDGVPRKGVSRQSKSKKSVNYFTLL